MDKAKKKHLGLIKRHKRIRKKIEGSQERPRVTIHRSLKYFYAQIIDDINGQTLVSVSSLAKDFGKGPNNIESAKKLGKILSEKAKEKKIVKVVFDRSGYRYHGRIKAFADAAREGGLQF